MFEYSTAPPPQSYTARKATFRLRLLNAFGISLLPLVVGAMLGGIPGLIASPLVGGYFLVKSYPVHLYLSRFRAVVEGAIAGAVTVPVAGFLFFLYLISVYATFYSADDEETLLDFLSSSVGDLFPGVIFIVVIPITILGVVGGQFGARSRKWRIRELNAEVERAVADRMSRYPNESGEPVNPEASGFRD